MNKDKQGEMIFGLHEDGIADAFGRKTFDLKLLSPRNAENLDTCVMGVSRRMGPKIEAFAPLVTYGVSVKKSNGPENVYANLMHVTEDGRSKAPLIAVYRQRKFDNYAREYFVLSIGVSGEVLKNDVRAATHFNPPNPIENSVYLNEALVNAAYRNYSDKVEVTAPFALGALHNILTNALTTPFTFIRDGKKKPGYTGGAHIGGVYFVAFPLEIELSYADDNMTHVGWFTQKDLQLVVAARDGMDSAGINHVPDTFRFQDPATHQRLGQLVHTHFEPWSARLIMDGSEEFMHVANFVTPPDNI